MIKYIKIKKTIAFFFLSLLTIQLLYPTFSWALTSGPSQPESKQFVTAGTSDMVDLFTGGFKYDVPIMDIDGFPVNLNYQSGVTMDDEASWVGLGWSLNVGAINRQLRGLPDDFKGDMVETEHKIKPKITYGGRLTVKGEITGYNIAKISGSLSLGVFSDNYTGIGADIGANAGLSFSLANSGLLTAGLGLSVNSSTSDGVSVTPNVSLSLAEKVNSTGSASLSVSASLGYNSRQGLKDISLSQSFGISGKDKGGDGATGWELNGSSYSYNTPPFYPQAGIGYKSVNHTYSIDVGLTYWTVFGGIGTTAYYSKREVDKERTFNPAYGFLYADKGTGQDRAMMDFMREKDNPVVTDLPNLAVPIATPDVFNYSSQAESGQFRLYRGGSGVLFDAASRDTTTNFTAGLDLGFGGYFHGGINFYEQVVRSITGKWSEDNNFLQKGDYPADSTKKLEEQVYFKRVGEKNLPDNNFIDRVQGENVVSVPLNGKTTIAGLSNAGVVTAASMPYKKDGRQVKRSSISWLTAAEAVGAALEKQNMNAPFLDSANFLPTNCSVGGTPVQRTGGVRKGHHLSEITVTGDDGKRMVYGLPVYNIVQDEYSFSVMPNSEIAGKNQVAIDYASGQINNKHGLDEYFHHEIQPAYATSFLLTAILSPDYVDVTGDGITDDDLGTAIKFNYSKVAGNYKWRTPYEANIATSNKGLLANTEDDKGSFVYGEKELWYLQSIESKTKIMYFLTADRDDALGVVDYKGGKNTTVRQKMLKEVRLYSKSNLNQPIKTAVLTHDYRLCPGVPNKVDAAKGTGKLTLKSIYFKYGNSGKGVHHPYVFTYDQYDVANPAYAYLSTDRWGTYKPGGNNLSSNLRNDEFPYSIQDKGKMDSLVNRWHLTKIGLPTGGEINVNYESGDYAYVQDKKAMEMIKIVEMVKANGDMTTELVDAKGLKVKLPIPLAGSVEAQTAFFKQHYLNGSNEFYAKLYVNVTDERKDTSVKSFDFIPCYAKVEKVEQVGEFTKIYFENMTSGGITSNPFIFAAWQKMRLEYQKYAYPGYQNRITSEQPLPAVLGALANALGNLAELKENFYQRAKRKKFANLVRLDKSFCRIAKADGKKLGGGARVKQVTISDNWNTMSGSKSIPAIYGQSYSYVKTENRNGKNDQEISSGVASYEPGIGSDENPLRMPVSYTEQMKWTMNNYFYLEEPFGEALYPAAQVGYSRITVKDIGTLPNEASKTGWTVHEFYTAKEFPVLVSYNKPFRQQNNPPGWHNFIGGEVLHELTLTQGYVVVLNDMHGKVKSERIYNQSGSEISSAVYQYNAEQIDAGKYRLRNNVTVTDENGVLTPNQVIGRELEMSVDMRQQEMSNKGRALQHGVDVIPFFWGIPLPIPHWPVKNNNETRLFRSACILKTVQYTGILDKVVKTVNGSTVTSSNLIYDKYTGEPVVTQTNNEFDDPVYNVNLPAYWVYQKMGGAYKNLNTQLEGFSTNSLGVVDSRFTSFLTAGDELVNLNDPAQRLWVIYSVTETNNTKELRVINRAGKVQVCNNMKVKVIRSGFRNQLTASTASIASLNNPIKNNRVTFYSLANTPSDGYDTTFQVLDAKATLFDEQWGVPITCVTCPSGYVKHPNGLECMVPVIENTNPVFKVVQGDRDATFAYGMDGASFYSTLTSTVPIRTIVNDFWGGDCGHLLLRGNSTNNIQPLEIPDSSEFGISKPAKKIVARAVGTSGGNEATIQATPGFCGRLEDSRIWLEGANGASYFDKWIGVETCFDVAEDGDYSFGFGVDNQVRIYIDDTLRKSFIGNVSTSFKSWSVYPIGTGLSKGSHRLRIEANNVDRVAAVGLEIYRGTPEWVSSVGGGFLVTIFSTKQLIGQPVSTYILDNGVATRRYTCPAGTQLNYCSVPCNCGTIPADGVLVNPYVTGYLGNWRPSEEKVFQVNRKDAHYNSNDGIQLRNSGPYLHFSPFWTNNGTKWDTSASNKWISARNITLYDRQGQELENRNVLNIYSSALYAYKNALPTAVASNAMQRQVFYDGFDDYTFRQLCNPNPPCDQDSFSIFKKLGANTATLVSTDAHTGNYSLKLTSLTLQTRIHQKVHKSEDYLSLSKQGEYSRKVLTDLYPRGFSPDSSKYVFSVWVKDGLPASNNVAINLKVNDSTIALTRKATVEGWGLVEGEIDMKKLMNAGSMMTVVLTAPGSNTLIDDLRIFPFDGLVKSYAYDDKTLKVMAVLDENNFATFYEYDDEGTLIRVKKETDRGIMTIQENRSAYRRN
jgi:hypothetical protein